jgi:FSR family fosmidomycin resistance protein-like MFS transporter
VIRALAQHLPAHQTSAIRAGQRRALALLTTTHLVDDMYQGAVPALLPFLALDRHYSYTALTGITLAATVLSSVIQPAFGVITDRRRIGWLVAAGPLVAGLGVGLSGVGNSYLVTWLAIAASGIGVAAYHPEATRTARGIAGNSTQAMSWFSVGGSAGISLGPLVVTPVLLVTGLAGTPVLALPAAAMAVLLAIRRPWRRDGRPGAAGTAETAGAGEAEAGSARPSDDWRQFARLTAVVIARSIAYFGVASLLALFVIRRFHEPAIVGSAALTSFVVAGVVGTLAGGWLADRWRRVAVLRLGYGCAAAALLAVVATPYLAVTFAAAIVLGLTLFAPFAVQVTLGQDYLPNRVGTASGMTLGLATTVGGLATPLVGLTADRYGLTIAIAALAAFPAIAAGVSFLLAAPAHRATSAH